MSDPEILVVDDDQGARETIEALLFSEGYALRFARSGREALDSLERGVSDLVLCDVMMPGMDGFEVCRTIKAHPEWRFVPIILVTALDDREDMLRGLESGADDFLHKPIEKTLLRARTRAMLRVRGQYQELHTKMADVDHLLQRRRARLIAQANLSSREEQVLDLLLVGRNHQEIGAVLGISARTAKFHQVNILEKLGADSRVDLLRIFA